MTQNYWVNLYTKHVIIAYFVDTLLHILSKEWVTSSAANL